MALTARIPTEILSLLSIAVMVIGLPIIMFILMADQVSLSLSAPAVTEPAANIPDDRAPRVPLTLAAASVWAAIEAGWKVAIPLTSGHVSPSDP